MTRHVKGSLFAEYVRMLRSRKEVDWSKHLAPEDESYLQQKILPAEWYPMATFERLGLAILAEIARGSVEQVQQWGRATIDDVRAEFANLVVEHDPRESLMRFQVLRRTFFDFPALEIRSLSDGEACVEVSYHMGKTAEQAAAYQTMGFFDRLLELSGARNCRAWFEGKSWEGAPVTTLQLRWE